jgi:hypothetical protein
MRQIGSAQMISTRDTCAAVGGSRASQMNVVRKVREYQVKWSLSVHARISCAEKFPSTCANVTCVWVLR